MNSQDKIDFDKIYSLLFQIRANHPYGLRAVASGNIEGVLTRHGVSSHAALQAQFAVEYLEEKYPDWNLPEFNDVLTIALENAEKHPREDYPIVLAGQIDPSTGIYEHPDLLFTAENHNARPLAIECDASQSLQGGLSYYQDWRDESEISGMVKNGYRILSCFDARKNHRYTAEEITRLNLHDLN